MRGTATRPLRLARWTRLPVASRGTRQLDVADPPALARRRDDERQQGDRPQRDRAGYLHAAPFEPMTRSIRIRPLSN